MDIPTTANNASTPEEVCIEDFEQSFQTLQELVQRLERQDMTLAESLKCYEQASRLTKICEKQLSAVDKQVREITERI